jgi:hypothetical protein
MQELGLLVSQFYDDSLTVKDWVEAYTAYVEGKYGSGWPGEGTAAPVLPEGG